MMNSDKKREHEERFNFGVNCDWYRKVEKDSEKYSFKLCNLKFYGSNSHHDTLLKLFKVPGSISFGTFSETVTWRFNRTKGLVLVVYEIWLQYTFGKEQKVHILFSLQNLVQDFVLVLEITDFVSGVRKLWDY